jgi:antirestriction protein ArdC
MQDSKSFPANWSRLLIDAITKPGLLLAAYSHFHNYSVGNQVLAISQCMERGLEPSPIATFNTWKERGRYVRKGEKALTLCMPITCRREDNADEHFTRFIYRPRWFVLSQTEGQEVAPQAAPAWDKETALRSLNITETAFQLTDGNTQGYAKKRSISISPIAALPHKTTFHELAHVVLGHTTEADFSDAQLTPRDLREVEAEAVALICCESLNLSGADYARGYIQNWLEGKAEIPERSAQRIFSAADSILKAGNPAANEAALAA